MEDRHGRRIEVLSSRTPEEEFRDKIAELERKSQDLLLISNVLASKYAQV